jgi:L-seryl-tRNA(Ser) seleniumtransferase
MTDPRQRLPAVNTLIDEAERGGLLNRLPRQAVVDAARAVLAEARQEGGAPPASGWLEAVALRAENWNRSSLTGVVNATGVVLHTNMGRAPLAREAYEAAEQALGYSTLELDLETGERGSRQDHLRSLLREVTGADDGLVVTNAAAALFLLLNTLSADSETIVSRGELVEIGGSFRIPEILAKSGSLLVEVGTTNRTRLKDYTLALSPRTRALLKVHRSNFEVVGFTEETSLAELADLARSRGLPVIHDIGSGLLVDLSTHGLSGEPLVRDSVSSGAATVFSGDKLVGGPQAGIIVGPTEIVEKARTNPLARALRPDKFTVAALEATLSLYRYPDLALTEIPALSMLTMGAEELERRAQILASILPNATTQPGESAVGGGAFPGAHLATTLVSIDTDSPQDMLNALRRFDPPVIARVADGCLLFDVRTVRDEQFQIIENAVSAATER